MTNRIIFLDMDGVVVRMEEVIKTKSHFMKTGNNVSFLCESCVDVLNKIVEKTGAEVVISSAWRMIYTPVEMQGILDENGFKGKVIGSTPVWTYKEGKPGVIDSCHDTRGQEIQQWINDNVTDKENFKFVILDDSNDMGELLSKLVRTPSKTGLAEMHIQEAVDLLS